MKRLGPAALVISASLVLCAEAWSQVKVKPPPTALQTVAPAPPPPAAPQPLTQAGPVTYFAYGLLHRDGSTVGMGSTGTAPQGRNVQRLSHGAAGAYVVNLAGPPPNTVCVATFYGNGPVGTTCHATMNGPLAQVGCSFGATPTDADFIIQCMGY